MYTERALHVPWAAALQLYMYVSIAQFTRDYWCASELELRLEGFDRSVTRKTVVQLRRHCTLIWGRWGEGEKWEGKGV